MVSSDTTAFDGKAQGYDAEFTATRLGVALRAMVWVRFEACFAGRERLLEIGCGTGEDALALLERGHRVVACDPAPAMIATARAKAAAVNHGSSAAIEFVLGSVEKVADGWSARGQAVDGVFSNFAPLNCEPSLAPLRLLLERALRRGGRFIAVVLPQVCPLEVALFMARAEPRAALRRFRRAAVADVEGQRFTMKYYGGPDFDRALGGGFRRIETRSLGLFLPPLSFGPAFARVPGLLTALGALEDRFSALPGLRRMGDHVLLVYERS